MKIARLAWALLLCFPLLLILPAYTQREARDTIKSIRGKPPKSASRTNNTGSRRVSARRTARRSSSKPASAGPVSPSARPSVAPPPPPAISVRAMGLNWRPRRGDNILETNEEGIHLAQRDPKDTTAYAFATAPLNLYDSSIWKVSFTLQFGKLESNGTRIVLKSGASPVAQVSADGLQNGIIAYLGGAEQRFARKFDAQAHRFDVIGTASRANLWMDGVQIGEGPIPGKPDSISMGPVSPAAGRQTEVWLRNVTPEPTAATQGMVDLFNGKDRTGWTIGRPPWNVEDGILRSIGGAEPDCVMFETQIPADAFVLSMRLRVMDGRRLRVFIVREPILLAHLAGMYFGNEGDNQTIALFGKDMSGAKARGGTLYNHKEWYDFRVEVDASDNVVMLQNGVVTFTAHRTARKPVWLAICAGDGFSAGHVEIASVRLSAQKTP
jgi:hypothetical protein